MPTHMTQVQPVTQFSTDPPMGLWDTSKLNTTWGPLMMIGGSNPAEGKSPYDDFTDQTSGDAWFSNPLMSDSYDTEQR